METEFVLSLGEQRWTLPAGTDTITIGRASNADIRLQADDQISRIHARLSRSGTTWTLYDESRNGTGLNGRRLTAPTPLTPGDQIHIGRALLTFHQSPTPAHPDPTHSEPAPEPGSLPAGFAGTGLPASGPAASVPPVAGAPSSPPVADGVGSGHEAGQYASPDAYPGEPPSPGVDDRYLAGDAVGSPFAPGRESDPSNPFASEARSEPTDEQYPPNEPQYPEQHPSAPQYGEQGGYPEDAAWAAYPSANSPEPARSPWEMPPPLEQSQPSWNESAGWPDPTLRAQPDLHPGDGPVGDSTVGRRTGDRRTGDRRSTGDRRTGDRRTGDRRTADRAGPQGRIGVGAPVDDSDEEFGTVRLPRILMIAGGVILLGLVINLIVTFIADGPGGELRWLVPPALALVLAMVLALLDAADPRGHAPSRLDVSIVVAIAVVLVGVGVGGFAVTAGVEYVGNYLTGNESGEARLIKPVAKTTADLTVTVESVLYTSHFTRVDVALENAAKDAVTLALDGTTLTSADATAIHADPGRSDWPGTIPAGRTERGTITFTGHLPDTATEATLAFTSGNDSVAVPGITLTT